jgi:HEAT repeat protein
MPGSERRRRGVKMPARRTMEDRIARLAGLKQGGPDEAGIAELRAAISGANNVLPAAGARAVARCGLRELVPEMVAAFDRFMDAPAKDKGCNAKTAIAEALNRLDYDRPDAFLRGIDHVQMEPVYGGRVDTAADLRCECAAGLLRVGHPDLMRLLTGLLFDTETAPRRAAVRALGLIGTPECELLLRAKALSGDCEPAVMGECFQALLEVVPGASLHFVARFLDCEDPAVSGEAAMALGGARSAEALELLLKRWEDSVRAEVKEELLVPIALTRREEALEFLLKVLSGGPTRRAAAALDALRICDDAGERRRRIEGAVRDRDEPEVTRAFEAAFGAP